MTDAELDELTERAMAGDLSEAEYDRLTRRAIRRGEALLADPKKLAKAAENAFVPAPKRRRAR